MDRVFIHIPKNAGTSVRIAIGDTSSIYEIKNDSNIRPHQPLFIVERNNSNIEPYAVVRNPFTRAYSIYIYGRNKQRHFEGMPLDSFSNFINALLRFKFMNKRYMSDEHLFQRSWVYWTQSFMLKSHRGLNTKVFRYESLKELEDYLGVVLPRANVGMYQRRQLLRDYTPENIDMVREYYIDDFINFDYDLDFERCLG